MIVTMALIDRVALAESYSQGEWLRDSLAIDEDFDGSSESVLGDSVGVSEDYSYSIDHLRTLNDSLQVKEAYAGEIDRLDVIGDPGEGLSPAQTVTIEYGSLSLTLTGPEFGNTDTDTPRRIDTQTRGLTRVIHRDPSWPSVRRFSMQFTFLSAAEAEQLRIIARASFGSPVTLTDYLGQSYSAIITTAEEDIVQPLRGGYSASIAFEVV